jgi:hypothetical protein
MGSARWWAISFVWLAACGGATGAAPPPTAGAGAAPSATGTEAPSEAAATVSDVPLVTRIPLLGGRLVMSAPEGAKAVPRPHSIMAADESSDEETRVILEPGKGDLARFVLLAREAFVLGSGRIESDAKALLGPEAAEVEVLPATFRGGLSGVALSPKDVGSSHGILFVQGAVIERSDHTLCELSFYILDEMKAERGKYTKRARAMLAGVEPSKGRLLASRDHRLDTGAGSVLLVSLPRDAVMTRQDGPDFFVYHLRELAPVGADAPEMGIYIGGYPSHQWEQAGVEASRVKKSRGKLLGKNVDWYSWQPATGLELHEAIADAGGHVRVHVFVSGSAKGAQELWHAAEAMQAKPK